MGNSQWESFPINELCIFAIDCVNKTAPIVDYETPYKMIRTTNVKDGFIDTESVRYVTEETFKKWTRRSKPQYGDVILTREAPVGSVGRFTTDDKNIFLGQRLFHYRPDPEKLDWNYLSYVLQSEALQGWLNGIAFGATVPHITVADAETIKIPTPPIDIQKKIGKILSNYDDLIENNLKQIKLLEEKARLTYEEWFLRFRIDGQKLDIDENTGLPFGWEKKKLESLIDYHIGGGWGEEILSDEFSEPAFVIRGTDFNNVKVGSLENVPYRYHKVSNLSSRKLKHKDIIFEVSGGSNTEGVAKTLQLNKILLDQFDNQVMCASFCKLVRTKSEDYSNLLFLFLQYLRDTRGTEVYELRSASNIVNYNWSAFLKFQETITPDIETIKLFNLKIDPIIDNIYNFAKQNQLLKESRDILLPRLMTGIIDVDKLDIEV
ncbi:MAG: restriction endonuclease subunit S [Arcobacter sp.]